MAHTAAACLALGSAHTISSGRLHLRRSARSSENRRLLLDTRRRRFDVGLGTSGPVGAAAGSRPSVSSGSLTPSVRRPLASAPAAFRRRRRSAGSSAAGNRCRLGPSKALRPGGAGARQSGWICAGPYDTRPGAFTRLLPPDKPVGPVRSAPIVPSAEFGRGFGSGCRFSACDPGFRSPGSGFLGVIRGWCRSRRCR